MQKLLLSTLVLALAGCQVTVKSQDGTATTYGLGPTKTSSTPAPEATPAPATAPVSAISPATSNQAIPSGLYSAQLQTQHKDGKGKLQNEVSKYSYLVEDLGGGRALVKFIGEGSAADPGGFGGLMSGEAQAIGFAVYNKGVWQFSGKSEDGPCEARFTSDNNTLKHLSGRCSGAGNWGDLAWPRANTPLKFVRALQASERSMLQTGGGMAPRAASTPASSGSTNPYLGLIGKTFPHWDLPYKSFGFDAFNSKLDNINGAEMPEGKVTVYAVRKGSARYVLIAGTAGNGTDRVLDVRPVAPAAGKHFVAVSEEGDVATSCTLNGKRVSQVFAYAQPGKRGSYSATASGKGENVWLVQPGGTQVIALRQGEKLVCTQTVFSG
ncbi:hypothetical protein [Leeia aquatica]|uniref:Uncharacterized protein n=1 Tax=Leeia aquatica TaxID=2725557 RepID=A0A847S5J1_9NEIS|nr:hypothetical protein [Leeia aquatica]NLR75114.1 hypothetical protein [Leeia aquatica]